MAYRRWNAEVAGLAAANTEFSALVTSVPEFYAIAELRRVFARNEVFVRRGKVP